MDRVEVPANETLHQSRVRPPTTCTSSKSGKVRGHPRTGERRRRCAIRKLGIGARVVGPNSASLPKDSPPRRRSSTEQAQRRVTGSHQGHPSISSATIPRRRRGNLPRNFRPRACWPNACNKTPNKTLKKAVPRLRKRNSPQRTQRKELSLL